MAPASTDFPLLSTPNNPGRITLYELQWTDLGGQEEGPGVRSRSGTSRNLVTHVYHSAGTKEQLWQN